MDMYILAHEFHYTPEQIDNMDLVYRADLISFWQGQRESERNAIENGGKKKHKAGERVPIEDQIMDHLMAEKERREREK